MTASLENILIDTSSIEYPKTGIRLLKFIKTVYGDEVLEKIKKGVFLVMLGRNIIRFDENFRNYRVHEDTDIDVSFSIEFDQQLWEILQKFQCGFPETWEDQIIEVMDNLRRG